MFEAIVLFCAIGVTDLNQCVTAEDTRGPYETKEECYARVQEMIPSIDSMLPPTPKKYFFKCEELQKGVST